MSRQFCCQRFAADIAELSQWSCPLAGILTNVSHLIVCPGRAIERLPIEMLPVGNKFLIEEKNISYVTSGREIGSHRGVQSPVFTVQSRSIDGQPGFNWF